MKGHFTALVGIEGKQAPSPLLAPAAQAATGGGGGGGDRESESCPLCDATGALLPLPYYTSMAAVKAFMARGRAAAGVYGCVCGCVGC